MNIILSHKQYKQIYIPEYQQSKVDNEIILYFIKENQIVILNQTAGCIWKIINEYAEYYDFTKDITLYEIFDYINKNFEIALDIMGEEVLCDIEETINLFVERRILYCQQ